MKLSAPPREGKECAGNSGRAFPPNMEEILRLGFGRRAAHVAGLFRVVQQLSSKSGCDFRKSFMFLILWQEGKPAFYCPNLCHFRVNFRSVPGMKIETGRLY